MPFQRISPASGADSPASMRSSVVLPVPFAPVTTSASPGADAKREPGEEPGKAAARGEFLSFQHREGSGGAGRGTAESGGAREDAPPGFEKAAAIIADAPPAILARRQCCGPTRDAGVVPGLVADRPCGLQGLATGLAIMAPAHSARERPMPDKDIRAASLEYHRQSPPGKISIQPTKQLTNQRDLALAYTPGVAAACDEIVRDPAEARNLTARGNLVGVVTNGTAVLGLGPIGPLAAKPVMEGKAVLFKKFAGIDCFDIEIDERDPDKLVDIIAALEPTFGGINLEDIKAPECFYVERKLRERMKIPVFHDDQHGTAIIVGAAITNGLRVVGKELTGRQARLLGRGRRGARVPRPARAARHPARRTSGSPTSRASSTQGRTRGDGRQQGALRAADRGAHARRDPRRRRHLPRALRGARC